QQDPASFVWEPINAMCDHFRQISPPHRDHEKGQYNTTVTKKPVPTSQMDGARRANPKLGPGAGSTSSRISGKSGPLAQNRRARHEYEVIDTFECGIALLGSEIKSIRAGKIQLQDAYARIDKGEAWLIGAHIAPYQFAVGAFGGHDPTRPRKLLLHRKELDALAGKISQKSLTLVPLSVYLRDGRAKVEIALARGRTNYDRRRAIADRDAKREIERAVSLTRSGKATH
ncbi:MAG TPA: SsrA-binding protein SmpB, partial [Acidimicrobiales bacterium]|nr:SsrA-binding protein SmpB [Acidimicrobiales bacterium]